MIPLEEYCKQNDIDNDVAALGYVCLRCACLYTVIVATMGNRIDAYGGDKKEVRNYLEWATAFSMIAHKSLKLNDMIQAQKSICTLYKDDCRKNYLKTGNMMVGTYMANDLSVCKDFENNTNLEN